MEGGLHRSKWLLTWEKKIMREGNKRRGEKIIILVTFSASKWNFDLDTTFLLKKLY